MREGRERRKGEDREGERKGGREGGREEGREEGRRKWGRGRVEVKRRLKLPLSESLRSLLKYYTIGIYTGIHTVWKRFV